MIRMHSLFYIFDSSFRSTSLENIFVSGLRQQLGVIIRHVLHQLLPSVPKEIREGGVPVWRQRYFIRVGPNLHPD